MLQYIDCVPKSQQPFPGVLHGFQFLVYEMYTYSSSHGINTGPSLRMSLAKYSTFIGQTPFHLPLIPHPSTLLASRICFPLFLCSFILLFCFPGCLFFCSSVLLFCSSQSTPFILFPPYFLSFPLSRMPNQQHTISLSLHLLFIMSERLATSRSVARFKYSCTQPARGNASEANPFPLLSPTHPAPYRQNFQHDHPVARPITKTVMTERSPDEDLLGCPVRIGLVASCHNLRLTFLLFSIIRTETSEPQAWPAACGEHGKSLGRSLLNPSFGKRNLLSVTSLQGSDAFIGVMAKNKLLIFLKESTYCISSKRLLSFLFFSFHQIRGFFKPLPSALVSLLREFPGIFII